METPSNMMPLGTIASAFSLLDTRTDEIVKLNDLKSDKATVLMFICNHCPFVIHIESVLVELVKEYQQSGVEFIAISANDVKDYPQDAPDLMKARALAHGYSFSYLYDETQEVAKAYDAAC
ncbi:MAG: redoxin domain-containing protein, partial [Gammaproteobacteria bacterium]